MARRISLIEEECRGGRALRGEYRTPGLLQAPTRGAIFQPMGLVHVTGRVTALTKRRFFETEFLVDTGALNCMAPASAFRKIGVRPEGKEVFELANGTTAEYAYAFARLSFMGAETVTRFIFGPEGVEPLLGVVALGDAAIGVDPVTRTLKRMSAKPLKVVGPPR
jgi:predicted aspartyl protease